jgi:hypothetical protein
MQPIEDYAPNNSSIGVCVFGAVGISAVTVSVLSSVCCSPHTLSGVMLNVVSSIQPDVLGTCPKQTIFLRLSGRRRRRSAVLLSQKASTDRPIPLLIKRELHCVVVIGGTQTQRQQGEVVGKVNRLFFFSLHIEYLR